IQGKKKVERFDACDPYQLMADAFVRHVRGKKDWVMPLEESLRFAELFDEAFALMKRPTNS
ncbi:MAG: hypothetical protein NTV47_07180, partial [Actinobacteria bacterium]|nr:hypothetical protein [Actinomycetota bacterium]